MGYWKEKAMWKEEDKIVKPIKAKCPKKKSVEVIWKDNGDGLGCLVCSYSGMESCQNCIKKGKYPK